MTNEITVFISSRESICSECGENLGRHAWITLVQSKVGSGEREALCLSCADLDHLVFLPSGDAALTRRARKHSVLSAVVVKWSSARKRYERQGLLVEQGGLEKAEEECLSDFEFRERRKEREAVKRKELDAGYVEQFAARVRELFPGCPVNREVEIAEHACRKYSGRIGRTASAKALEEQAVRLAVIAHIRHWETNYDELLAKGYERHEARFSVEDEVKELLQKWEAKG